MASNAKFRERTVYTWFEPALNQIKVRPGKKEDFLRQHQTKVDEKILALVDVNADAGWSMLGSEL